MTKPSLDILMPTYNRAYFTEKALVQLSEMIRNLEAYDQVKIRIHDNASTDDTQERVTRFCIENPDIRVVYFRQSKNLGMEPNGIDVLATSDSEFQMFLGDDFITEPYLKRVLNTINSVPDLGCIVPSFQGIDSRGNILPGYHRDINLPTRWYPPGLVTSVRLMNKAHQLSGLVVKKAFCYSKYFNSPFRNIYVFQALGALSMQKGSTLHLTEHPVLVTIVDSDRERDWTYGEDGLLPDRYKAIRLVFTGYPLHRFVAEIIDFRVSDLSLLISARYQTFQKRIKYLGHFYKCPHVTLITKTMASLYLVVFILFRKLKVFIRLTAALLGIKTV